MKISVQGNYSAYKNKFTEPVAGKAKNAAFPEALKTDLNSISKGSTAIPDKHMLAMKSSVQSYASASASAELIAGIRDRIQNGAYRVATDDIVNSIMDDGL